MYNIRSVLEQESFGETFMLNSMDDNEAEKKLDEIASSMCEATFKIPFAADMVRIVRNEEDYLMEFSELEKFAKCNNIHSVTEAINNIARHYDIPRNNIIITVKNSMSDMLTTANRLSEAAECGIPLRYTSQWEDAKLIDDDEWDDDEDEVITEKEPVSSKKKCDNKKCVKEHVSTFGSLAYNVDMVNVYSEDSRYYIEFSDIENYMNSYNIISIKEAVYNIASHNNFDWHDSVLVCETCDKIKKTRNKKAATENCKKTEKVARKLNKILNEG